MTAHVFQEEFGIIKSYNLKPGGDKIPVTNQNRKEYVQLYIDFLLNKSIYKQFAAFYYGFHSVCASNALMLLRPEEVEILVCGSPELDMHALQRSTQYDGYAKTDLTIRLPVAHTCFNQLCLPPYKSKKDLKQKLIIGISNSEGFGLE
ncbi:Itchy E3 ubiquitin protein ligase isoform 4-like protein [Camelus ferus]|nr:Itchy E3 ubiquitin protein ligase isoform 4-like protein [Camelus ferus]